MPSSGLLSLQETPFPKHEQRGGGIEEEEEEEEEKEHVWKETLGNGWGGLLLATGTSYVKEIHGGYVAAATCQ